MKNLLIIILLICTYNVSQAQINLVLNPSFEEYTHCPDFIDEAKYSTYWSSLDTAWNPPDWAHAKAGIPEFCNSCASVYYVSVPRSNYYYHYPRTGNGMMQMEMVPDMSDNFTYARDYLQGHLRHSLAAGHTYNVFFHVTSEQSSFYAINNVGAYLDDGTIDTTNHPGWTQYQYTPQIIDTNIINDTLNWHTIAGYFTATGNEKVITIGNFASSGHNHFIAVQDTTGYTGGNPTWYLIDDVSVIDCSNTPHAGNDTFILHPGDSVFIGPHEELLPYWWYVLGGSAPIDSGGGIWVKPTVTTTYILKQVLCDRVAYDTVRVRVWPDTVTNVAMAQLLNGSIYPSPTKGLLTVEGAKGCTVGVYDVLGMEVLGGIVATEKEVLDLEQLVKGVYMVVVTDRVTGFRVVRQVLKE